MTRYIQSRFTLKTIPQTYCLIVGGQKPAAYYKILFYWTRPLLEIFWNFADVSVTLADDDTNTSWFNHNMTIGQFGGDGRYGNVLFCQANFLIHFSLLSLLMDLIDRLICNCEAGCLLSKRRRWSTHSWFLWGVVTRRCKEALVSLRSGHKKV